MHRRSFLHAATIASAALVATACGQRGGSDGPPPAGAEQTLAVQTASIEILTGPGRWLAFGLIGIDGTPLDGDREVEVFLRSVPTSPDEPGALLAGPLPATFSPPADTGQGVWYLQTTLEDPGFAEIVVVSGEDVGASAVQVVDPSDSQVTAAADGRPMVPGAPAVPAPTPTTSDDLGVFAVCTQDPPCGMHEVSLDEAVGSGRPVVVLFATPQFCQTAVCGPSVATLDAIRQDGAWGDTIFIHSEIFAEEPDGAQVAGTPLTTAVAAWGLPSEPWLFTVAADGVIAGRLDGPMPQPVVRTMVEELRA